MVTVTLTPKLCSVSCSFLAVLRRCVSESPFPPVPFFSSETGGISYSFFISCSLSAISPFMFSIPSSISSFEERVFFAEPALRGFSSTTGSAGISSTISSTSAGAVSERWIGKAFSGFRRISSAGISSAGSVKAASAAAASFRITLIFSAAGLAAMLSSFLFLLVFNFKGSDSSFFSPCFALLPVTGLSFCSAAYCFLRACPAFALPYTWVLPFLRSANMDFCVISIRAMIIAMITIT